MPTTSSNSSTLFAAVSGSIGLLGIFKSILETASGESFNLQKVAFYVAIAAFIVYIVLAAAVSVASGLAQTFSEDDDRVLIAGLVIGGAVGVYLVLSGDWISYEDSSPGSRAFGAILGMVIVAGSLWIWNYLKTHEEPSERSGPMSE